MILDFRVHYIVIIEIIIRLKRLPPLILIHKSDLNNLLLSLLLRRTKPKSLLWEILISKSITILEDETLVNN